MTNTERKELSRRNFLKIGAAVTTTTIVALRAPKIAGFDLPDCLEAKFGNRFVDYVSPSVRAQAELKRVTSKSYGKNRGGEGTQPVEDEKVPGRPETPEPYETPVPDSEKLSFDPTPRLPEVRDGAIDDLSRAVFLNSASVYDSLNPSEKETIDEMQRKYMNIFKSSGMKNPYVGILQITGDKVNNPYSEHKSGLIVAAVDLDTDEGAVMLGLGPKDNTQDYLQAIPVGWTNKYELFPMAMSDDGAKIGLHVPPYLDGDKTSEVLPIFEKNGISWEVDNIFGEGKVNIPGLPAEFKSIKVHAALIPETPEPEPGETPEEKEEGTVEPKKAEELSADEVADLFGFKSEKGFMINKDGYLVDTYHKGHMAELVQVGEGDYTWENTVDDPEKRWGHRVSGEYTVLSEKEHGDEEGMYNDKPEIFNALHIKARALGPWREVDIPNPNPQLFPDLGEKSTAVVMEVGFRHQSPSGMELVVADLCLGSKELGSFLTVVEDTSAQTGKRTQTTSPKSMPAIVALKEFPPGEPIEITFFDKVPSASSYPIDALYGKEVKTLMRELAVKNLNDTKDFAQKLKNNKSIPASEVPLIIPKRITKRI